MNNPFPKWIEKIAITNIASTPKREEFQASFELLNKWGIDFVFPDNMFNEYEKNLPAPFQERLENLENFCKDSSVDAILSARGGYGSAQLLDTFDWNLLRKRNIPIIGYSDITAFHLAMLAKNAGIPISAPMGNDLSNLSKSANFAKSMCNSLEIAEKIQKNLKRSSFDFLDKIPLEDRKKLKVLRHGNLNAKLIATNLSVFTSMIGTKYMPNLDNCILLFEDINEPLYKIDRYLTQIKQSGIFAKSAALLIGDFGSNIRKNDINSIFAKFANEFDLPSISGINFGHIKTSLSFNIGEEISLDTFSI